MKLTARAAGQERLEALDVFRGLTMAGMVLVNNPGSGAHVYPPLKHALWDGCAPADLVFPSFLFIVGVSMALSFGRRQARGDSRAELLRHAVVRSLLLYAISFFLLGSFIPNFLDGRWPNFATVRIFGVLPRIALCYLLAAPVVLYTPRRAWLFITAGLLLGYFALMTLVPVPGHGAGLLESKEWNLEAYVDRWVLGKHIWRGSKLWDPEGLLSTLPAVGTALLGALTGDYLGRAPERGGTIEKIVALVVAGSALLALGMVWSHWFPMILFRSLSIPRAKSSGNANRSRLRARAWANLRPSESSVHPGVLVQVATIDFSTVIVRSRSATSSVFTAIGARAGR